jgi:hypothetical protein
MKIRKKDGTKKYALGGFIGGGLQAVAGVGQVAYGMQTLKKANSEMDSLLAGAPSLELPSAYKQYAAKALDQTNLRRQTEAINRRLATSTDALSKAGGRALLGGLQQSVTAANTAEQAALAQQNAQEMQGLQVLGQAQGQTQRMKEQRFQMQYGAADAAKQAALGNIGAGVGAAAGGILQAGMEFDKDMFKTGGKLEGEFSHKNNPITMTNKEGKVVGEATGDEYIINPTQAAAIKKESKYFRNLLKKKRFK